MHEYNVVARIDYFRKMMGQTTITIQRIRLRDRVQTMLNASFDYRKG